MEAETTTEYKVIESDFDLQVIINSIETLSSTENDISVPLDVEASGLDPHTALFLLWQIEVNDNTYVINVGKTSKEYRKDLAKALENVQCVGHNIKYDAKIIFHDTGVLLKNLYDTMLCEQLTLPGLKPPFISLAKLIENRFGVSLSKEERLSFVNKNNYDFTPELLDYAANDLKYIRKIMDAQLKEIERSKQTDIMKLEMRLLPVIAFMEYTGVDFDKDKWLELSSNAGQMLDDAHNAIIKYIEPHYDDIVNNAENAYVAFKTVGIPVLTKKYQRELESITTYNDIKAKFFSEINFESPKQSLAVIKNFIPNAVGSSKKALEIYRNDHEIIRLLSTERDYFKLKTVYGDEFIQKYYNVATSKIHGSLNQLGTRTGRLSSDNPNLQNIPASEDYRACFKARDGFLFARADYSQIELRILGDISGEPKFIEAYNGGVDLHTKTTSIIFDIPVEEASDPKLRHIGKTVNFAVVYGTTAHGLRYNFGWELSLAQDYLNRYYAEYNVLHNFIDLLGRKTVQHGYSSTVLGRRRYFKVPAYLKKQDIKDIYKIRRQGVNMAIQGTSADMIKIAIIRLFYNNPFGIENFRPLLTVHDEVVVEFKEDIREEAEKYIVEVMESSGNLFLNSIKAEVDIIVSDVWRK